MSGYLAPNQTVQMHRLIRGQNAFKWCSSQDFFHAAHHIKHWLPKLPKLISKQHVLDEVNIDWNSVLQCVLQNVHINTCEHNLNTPYKHKVTSLYPTFPLIPVRVQNLQVTQLGYVLTWHCICNNKKDLKIITRYILHVVMDNI